MERCFTRRLPLHERDEQESVAPRLLGHDPEIDRALEALARDHEDHQRPLAVLVTACKEIARVPAHAARLAPHVQKALGRVERLLERHFAREETVLFPAVRRFLDDATAAEILLEMRARQGGSW